MRRRVFKTLAFVMLLLGMTLPAQAVSQKEMEQARTITAFWYLRYANNGAGYMEDGKMPSSMSELEKMLKEKERTNLKAFKAVSTPTDYASWDKGKLVSYWSGTFFNSPGLSAEGKIARNKVKSKLNAMTVADPAPAAEQQAAEKSAPDASAAAPTETPAVAEPSDPQIPSAQTVAEQAQTADSASLAAAGELAATEREERKSSSGTTWIYIVALVVLVGVVVWLVIFASRTMQEGKGEKSDEAAEPETAPVRISHDPVASTPAPAETVAMRREIKSLRDECMRLGEENGRLQSDLAEARRELETLRGRLRAATAVTSAATAAAAHAPAAATTPAPAAREENEEPREIYLGRVNPKGLFVRADKRPVADKSVFVLTTADGYTGSYRVIQMEEVVSRCLESPDHYLSGGCTAPDILATDDSTQIRTLQSGTAIFENGCWRMIRKSKIVYE